MDLGYGIHVEHQSSAWLLAILVSDALIRSYLPWLMVDIPNFNTARPKCHGCKLDFARINTKHTYTAYVSYISYIQLKHPSDVCTFAGKNTHG